MAALEGHTVHRLIQKSKTRLNEGSNTHQSTLLQYNVIPPWQRDNEFILSGYRPTSNSLLISLRSMLWWHNETEVNIYSHTLGSLVFALFPVHFYNNLYFKVEAAQMIDAYMFLVYFVGVSICFACSTSCHVIWNLNPKAASFGNKLDFCGIALLMWSASLASIHFAFICHPGLRTMHWLLVSVSGGLSITFTLYPRFITPAFRTYRAILYASLGFFAIIFIGHVLWLDGFAVQRKRLALEWMVLMALLNLVGALVYAIRFPERWYPYQFDFIGASHQLFHMFVLAAGIIHYKALAKAFLEVRTTQLIC